MFRCLAPGVLTLVLAACAATPVLNFAPDESGGGAPDSSVPANDAAHADAASTDGADVTVDDGAAPVDAPSGSDAGTADSAPIDSAPPPYDAASDAAVPDASVSDAAVPDAGAVCTPNVASGIGCCPNGEECTGVACQHCDECTACALPNVCCAVVNGGGKYKSMKCSASPVGCP